MIYREPRYAAQEAFCLNQASVARKSGNFRRANRALVCARYARKLRRDYASADSALGAAKTPAEIAAALARFDHILALPLAPEF